MPEESSAPQIDALVVAELAIGHVAVVAHDLPQVLRRHVLLRRLHEAELAALGVALALHRRPPAHLLLQLLLLRLGRRRRELARQLRLDARLGRRSDRRSRVHVVRRGRDGHWN